MDELHTLVGAGAVGGSMDAANILKPALARGELHAIGATTVREYRQYIEKDAALERRFQPVYLAEPSVDDALAILRGLKEKYEVHHGIRITDDALISAVMLSTRYIPDRFLPDKAIDLVDEAASSLKIDTESMPLELDEIRRSVTQLEIERAALRREKDSHARVTEIDAKLAGLRVKEEALGGRWNKQKELVGKLQDLRVRLDSARSELEKAEREALLDKAAKLKYGDIPELEKHIRKLEKQLAEIPDEERMLREEVRADDVARVVARWTGVPVMKLLTSEADKLIRLEEELKKRVVGQDDALKKVADAVRRNRAGIGEENKPIGSFLFLGPTGVGKTETARALAAYLFNDERAMVRIDMSEYQEPHSVARLIGAPPGYVGYEDGGQLTEAVRRKPYSVVLLDEVEKAHRQVFNVFLQVFDEGRLTDGRGRQVNFRNSIIIMTSNLASTVISEFGGSNEDRMNAEVGTIVRKTFPPEFLNRLDQTVIFRQLTPKEILKIVGIQLSMLRERLEKQGISVSFTEALKNHLAGEGFDPVYGARPLKRVIQDTVLDEIALLMIEKKITAGSKIKIDHRDGKLSVSLPH